MITTQLLNDEINTLQLELTQIEERNSILTRDNAKLLQRWLDAKQAEANKMNEANDFYEDMRSRHQAVMSWRDKSAIDGNDPEETGTGNGVTNGDRKSTQMKDGTKFPPDPKTNLNPNG